MTCRRCDGVIGAGGVANIIRSVVVGNCCLRADEDGYREDVDGPVPSSRPTLAEMAAPGLALPVRPRRVEVMQLAEDGLVTRQGNQVNAFDRAAGRMRDSKSVAMVLIAAGLAFWEKQPLEGFHRELVRWKLRLTSDGDTWLRNAEKELSVAADG